MTADIRRKNHLGSSGNGMQRRVDTAARAEGEEGGGEEVCKLFVTGRKDKIRLAIMRHAIFTFILALAPC